VFSLAGLLVTVTLVFGSALSMVSILGTALSAGALWLVASRLMRSFGGAGLDALVGMSRAR